MISQLLQNRTGAAITGVSHNLHGLQSLDIHIAQQMLDISGPDVHLFHLAKGLTRHQLMGHIVRSSYHLTDFLQARIRANGTSIPAHQLHAVIFLRIMASGNHNTAVSL